MELLQTAKFIPYAKLTSTFKGTIWTQMDNGDWFLSNPYGYFPHHAVISKEDVDYVIANKCPDLFNRFFKPYQEKVEVSES